MLIKATRNGGAIGSEKLADTLYDLTWTVPTFTATDDPKIWDVRWKFASDVADVDFANGVRIELV